MVEGKVLPKGVIEYIVLVHHQTMELLAVVKKSRNAFRDFRLHTKDSLTDERAETLLADCNAAIRNTQRCVFELGKLLGTHDEDLDGWGYHIEDANVLKILEEK